MAGTVPRTHLHTPQLSLAEMPPIAADANGHRFLPSLGLGESVDDVGQRVRERRFARPWDAGDADEEAPTRFSRLVLVVDVLSELLNVAGHRWRRERWDKGILELVGTRLWGMRCFRARWYCTDSACVGSAPYGRTLH